MSLRTLFLKIFMWFWLATAAMIGVLALMVLLSISETLPERTTRGTFGEALSLYSETAVRTYQRDGVQALEQFVARSLKEAGTEIFLFDANGKPLTSIDPANVQNMLQQLQQQQTPQRISQVFLGRVTWGKQVAGADGKRYFFITRFQQPGPGARPPTLSPFRIAVMILTAGLVCYLLATYLTSPVKKLQSAVQSFAEGNLDARVSPALGNRKDELADLGREFDHMAERIEALIYSQQRLLGDISHELRSPLARLSVALELARKNSTERAAPALDRIEQEGERLNKLVGQLLALTRLESGAEKIALETVMLEDLVQQVIDDANFEANPLRKEVTAIQLEACRVNGSPELLRSAIENVIRNAVRYTPTAGAVEVSLRWKLDTAELTVNDQGPGVPEAELKHIFEPFYRVSEARERTSGGAGLGLSIADRTVKLHGGTIEASNSHSGLRVLIRLPLAPNQNKPDPSQSQAAFSPASLASG